jgi:predicted pyridoxine 5'-phosphate oxidase superfamily flavin-nucleotide-binding protein
MYIKGSRAETGRHLDERTIGWADYVGNRQYVAVGNTVMKDWVAMIFMDYPHQRRLKVLGHMQAFDAGARPDLSAGDRRPERLRAT